VEAYHVLGCLYLAPPDRLGYALALHPPNPTATEASAADTLVHPTGWYQWTGSRVLWLRDVPADVLNADCRDSLQAHVTSEAPR
jgi:hypothetical protein